MSALREHPRRPPLRAFVPVLALAGAVVLTVLPLLRPTDPFDAALRVTVWLAVVVAAASGAGKPAALFGAVAALVETCGALLDSGGPGDSWAPVPAVVVAAVLLASRKAPGLRRFVTRLVRRRR